MVEKRHREKVDELGVQHRETNQRLRLCCRFATLCSCRRELFQINDHSFWESFLRKIVGDVVDRAFLLHKQSLTGEYSFNEAGTSRSRALQLHFSNQLENDIFTLEKIRAQDGKPVQVVLRDASSEYAIVQSGPLSSAKVDLLVINGDFGSGNHEDWNEEEFKSSVLCSRDGKRPLIVGTLSITLKDGIGFILDLYFTDNSRWIPCKKFRLGARIGENISFMRVKEAISQPFRVKENRGEGYRKHHPPHLEDELFRLEGISKDGKIYSRLQSNNIRTVKDFLQKIETDPSSVRRIIGRISDGDWNRLVEHARKCVMDNKLYAYRGFSVLFNSAYQVVLASFDGQNFNSMDDLDINQRSVVNGLRQLAYKDLGSFVQVDNQSALNLRPLSHLLDMQCSVPSMRFQNLDLAVTLQSCDSSNFAGTQDQPVVHGLASYNFGPTSYNGEANLGTDSRYDAQKTIADLYSYEVNIGVDSFGDSQNIPATEVTNSMTADDLVCSTSYQCPVNYGNLYPQQQNSFVAQQSNAAFEDDFIPGSFGFGHILGETSQFSGGFPHHEELIETSSLLPDINPLEQLAQLLSPSNTATEVCFVQNYPNSGMNLVRHGRTRWFKVRAALICSLSIRRDAAARRRSATAKEGWYVSGSSGLGVT